ncbi:hypothetical protein [Bacillus cereus]|uniref:hypothetical protein n=1 Tax=Bacillus cereus TaxID=1396 RepID=UPI000BF7403A|nr:hypothetical protein [Bacillus cereus]PFA76825.1 hypothetical protein CN406_17360 [Bacillus cereus]
MNIERLFHEEIRDKKRIGSNIFSRVSTRKGGGNQALRTPSYFMKGSNKYKKLSGDVEVYNLNDIISYQEFSDKDKSQQKMFMEAWKAKYKVKEIQDKMGISKNVYYKILENLGLPTEIGRGRHAKNAKPEDLHVILSDEEMDKYMGDFVDFSLFKQLPKHQQITLLESYLKDFPVQSELAKVWGADLKYVYYINSVAKKQKQKQEKKENEGNVEVVEEHIERKEETTIPAPVESIVATDEKLDTIADEAVVEDKPQDIESEEDNTIEETVESQEDNIMEETRQNEENDNSLTIEIKGNYSTNAIMKSIQSILTTLEDEEEVVNIDLRVRKR